MPSLEDLCDFASDLTFDYSASLNCDPHEAVEQGADFGGDVRAQVNAREIAYQPWLLQGFGTICK
ncbi:MAG: hypothetical protein C4296_14565 [Gemmataceae bacterium]